MKLVKSEKKIAASISITPSLKKKIEDLAKQEGRSFTNYIVRVMELHARSK